jgi:hypothetical protein
VLPSVTQVFLKQMFRAAEQASAFPLRPQGWAAMCTRGSQFLVYLDFQYLTT